MRGSSDCFSGPRWRSARSDHSGGFSHGAQWASLPTSSPNLACPVAPPEKRVKSVPVPDPTSPGEEPGGGRLSSLFSLYQFIVNQALTLNFFSLVPQPSFYSFVEAISLSPLLTLWPGEGVPWSPDLAVWAVGLEWRGEAWVAVRNMVVAKAWPRERPRIESRLCRFLAV